MRLKNQVAIVTGAASGFGAEIARQSVAEGAKVAVADIIEAGVQAVAGELGESAIAVRCDVTKLADIDALVAATTGRWGTVDIVVNNAAWRADRASAGSALQRVAEAAGGGGGSTSPSRPVM